MQENSSARALLRAWTKPWLDGSSIWRGGGSKGFVCGVLRTQEGLSISPFGPVDSGAVVFCSMDSSVITPIRWKPALLSTATSSPSCPSEKAFLSKAAGRLGKALTGKSWPLGPPHQIRAGIVDRRFGDPPFAEPRRARPASGSADIIPYASRSVKMQKDSCQLIGVAITALGSCFLLSPRLNGLRDDTVVHRGTGRPECCSPDRS